LEVQVLTYKTIAESSTGMFKDKGSKFLSFAFPVKTEQEIKPIIDRIKKEYFDARHHCFAYRLGPEKQIFRTNDDGEPSGTAGKPIFGQIQSNDLTNILIVVVRYFGGTLLGTSGLIHAYKHSSADAIANANVIECNVYSVYTVNFDYADLNKIMKICKDFNLSFSDSVFDLKSSITINIKKAHHDQVLAKLQTIEQCDIIYLHDE
jgi:uncharacterized YigZ family protein